MFLGHFPSPPICSTGLEPLNVFKVIKKITRRLKVTKPSLKKKKKRNFRLLQSLSYIGRASQSEEFGMQLK